MIYVHPHTLHEIQLLRNAAAQATPRPRRVAPWRERVRALLREQLRPTVATVDADMIASPLTYDTSR